MSEYRLTQEIMDRSFAKTWAEAKLEWEIAEVYKAHEPETCLCGHFPIIELCVLVNKITGQTVTVGNCCVRKFFELPADKIFEAFKRVGRDPTKSLNAEAVQHAFKVGWIDPYERKFYLDILSKRKGMRGKWKLSEKQTRMKTKINAKVAAKMRTHSHARGRSRVSG